jgi:hypothetical protein
MIIEIEPYPAAVSAIEKRLAELGKEDRMQDVLKKAVNEVAGLAKDRIYEEVHDTYTLKGFKKADIKKKNSTVRNIGATLTVRGEPLGVGKYYQHRKGSKRNGARVKILRASMLQELEVQNGQSVYKAFMAKMKSGHEGVFQRVPGKYMKKHMPGRNTKGREAIKEIVSLSKAKAAEMVYEREGMYTELQEELTFRLHKHMNAVIGGST